MAKKKKYHVSLSDDEVKRLKALIRNGNSSRTVKCRCQILLDLDEAHGKDFTHEQAAKATGVCIATVTNIVRQYVEEGLEATVTLKRNINSDNARRKLDGRAEARIIEIACTPAPEGRSRWTLRLLEEQAKIVLETPVGKNAIGRALKKTNFGLTKTITGASPQKKMRNL